MKLPDNKHADFLTELEAEKQKVETAENEINISVYKTLTPEQAETWIDNNVTNLASAKLAMKHMVKMIIALRDYVLR